MLATVNRQIAVDVLSAVGAKDARVKDHEVGSNNKNYPKRNRESCAEASHPPPLGGLAEARELNEHVVYFSATEGALP